MGWQPATRLLSNQTVKEPQMGLFSFEGRPVFDKGHQGDVPSIGAPRERGIARV